MAWNIRTERSLAGGAYVHHQGSEASFFYGSFREERLRALAVKGGNDEDSLWFGHKGSPYHVFFSSV